MQNDMKDIVRGGVEKLNAMAEPAPETARVFMAIAKDLRDSSDDPAPEMVEALREHGPALIKAACEVIDSLTKIQAALLDLARAVDEFPAPPATPPLPAPFVAGDSTLN